MSEYLTKINVLTQQEYDSSIKNDSEIYLISNNQNYNDTINSPTAVSNIYNIDLSIGRNFIIDTIDTVSKTMQFSNVPTTENTYVDINLLIAMNHLQVITFPTAIWENDTIPTLVESKLYKIKFESYNNGLTWNAYLVASFNLPVLNIGISDTFTREDNIVSLGNADTGEAWVTLSGTWGIISNTAYPVTSTSGTKLTYIETSKSDNITISCDVLYVTGVDAGIIFRVVDSANYIQCTISQSNSSVFVKKVISGVASDIVSAGFSRTLGNYVNIKVVLSGNSITAYLDDASLLTASSSALLTGTKCGLKHYAGTNVRFDNFKVYDN